MHQLPQGRPREGSPRVCSPRPRPQEASGYHPGIRATALGRGCCAAGAEPLAFVSCTCEKGTATIRRHRARHATKPPWPTALILSPSSPGGAGTPKTLRYEQGEGVSPTPRPGGIETGPAVAFHVDSPLMTDVCEGGRG